MNLLFQWADVHCTAYLLAAPLTMLLNGKLLRFRAEQAVLNRLFAASGLLLALHNVAEILGAWYSGTEDEQYAFINRATGPYWWAYWAMLAAYVLAQLFWLNRLRTSKRLAVGCILLLLIPLLFPLVLPYLPGSDYLPSSWFMFSYKQLLLLPLALLYLAEACLLVWLANRLRRRYSR